MMTAFDPVAALGEEGGEADVGAKLIAFSRERLAHYKCPTEVLTVDALPRNAMGKVTKADLARRFTE